MTALAQSTEISLANEPAGTAENVARRGLRWPFRAVGDALLLFAAWAGSWAIVMVAAFELARLF